MEENHKKPTKYWLVDLAFQPECTVCNQQLPAAIHHPVSGTFSHFCSHVHCLLLSFLLALCCLRNGSISISSIIISSKMLSDLHRRN